MAEKNSYKKNKLNASHIIIYIYFWWLIPLFYPDQQPEQG
jgi:hypothetical protein